MTKIEKRKRELYSKDQSELLPLNKYIELSERLLNSFIKRIPRGCNSHPFLLREFDFIVSDMVKVMVEADLKYDPLKSKLNRHNYRNMLCIYLLRKIMYEKSKSIKNKKEMICGNQFYDFENMATDCIESKNSEITRDEMLKCLNNIPGLSSGKKYLKLLIDGYSIKDIAKRHKTTVNNVNSILNSMCEMYNNVSAS